MNRVGARFGVAWPKLGIDDPSSTLPDGGVRFHTFYPDAPAQDLGSATSGLTGFIKSHPVDLDMMLEQDGAERGRFAGALRIMQAASASFPSAHPAVQALARSSEDLLAGRLGVDAARFLARPGQVDAASASVLAFFRERFLRTLKDSLPATPAGRQRLAAAAKFSPGPARLLLDYGLLLMDNSGLDVAQIDAIGQLMAQIPAQLLDVGALSVLDYLAKPGAPWPGMPLELDSTAWLAGRGAAVNVFGARVGAREGNPFPPDVAPRADDLFSIVVAHELTHVVDGEATRLRPELAARRQALLDVAGCDQLNYLRSTVPGVEAFPDCFFIDNPGELVASMANQAFNDTGRMLELGLTRFDYGRHDPINQFLYLADIFSVGGNETRSFESHVADGQFVLSHSVVPLERDAAGHITKLRADGVEYRFTLDSNGNVVSYSVVRL